MSPKAQVSVILPVHNGSRYLREALESCLAQSFQAWELIAVDDCSTDDTPKILAEFSARDSRIRSVRNDHNLKLPASLNVGFRLARGRYLTWTSDDNRFKPEMLSRLASYLDAHPDIGLVYSDFETIDENGRSTGTTRVGQPDDLWKLSVVGCSFLYRREIYDTLGGYAEDLFLAEDYEYWLRASTAYRIAPLHESLYEYRYHPSSLTSRREPEIRRAAAKALARHLPRLSWMSPQSRIEGHFRVLKRDLLDGRPRAAVTCLVQALQLSPRVTAGVLGRKLLRVARSKSA